MPTSQQKKEEQKLLDELVKFYKRFMKDSKVQSSKFPKLCQFISKNHKKPAWYLFRAQLYRMLGRNQLAFCDYNTALLLEKNCIRAYVLYVPSRITVPSSPQPLA